MDLVLVHGINNTGRGFDRLRAALPGDWHVQTPDLPALACVDRIAAALLPDLPPRFVLAGHSFGGYVALALLAMVPDRVAGLVLINSSAGADTVQAAAAREDRARAAETGSYEAIAQAATARSFHPDNLARADLMTERAAEVAAYGPARFAAHNRACAMRADRRALAAAWPGPKLVIAARDDQVIPAARQTDTATAIGARLALIAGAGHMAPAEAPAAIAAAIVEFVQPLAGPVNQR